jgi:hypothetical protein
VANETEFFSSSDRKQHSAAGKSEHLQRILDCILESFKAAQLPGALSNTNIRLGREEKMVNLYVPWHFQIGDVERAAIRFAAVDHIAYRHASKCAAHAMYPLRIVTKQQTDANALKRQKSKNSICIKTQRLSIIYVNALHLMLSMTLIAEKIHMGFSVWFILRVFMLVQILMKELSTGQHGTLDRLVKKLNRCPHQHGYNGFPRCTWPDGVTSRPKLTGDQRVGRMFVILLVAITEEGQKFFETYLPVGNNTWQWLVYCFVLNRCFAIGRG